MTDEITCDICYELIQNKISLVCSHELCLKCFVNILRKINKPFSCPMCRKEYKDIYLYHEEEEQVFAIPDNYEVNVIQHNASEFRDIILRENEDDNCEFYEAFINYGEVLHQVSFIILYTGEIEASIIEQLLHGLILLSLPYNTSSLHELRQGIVKIGHYEIRNTNHYLQDYFDVCIERIVNV
jgi:hypothetical protein